jgi:hypothetical protein
MFQNAVNGGYATWCADEIHVKEGGAHMVVG